MASRRATLAAQITGSCAAMTRRRRFCGIYGRFPFAFIGRISDDGIRTIAERNQEFHSTEMGGTTAAVGVTNNTLHVTAPIVRRVTCEVRPERRGGKSGKQL